MSRQGSGAKPRRQSEQAWSRLTWDDLEDWAGSRSASRGQAYQRQGQVQNLVVSEDHRLLATVVGSDDYVTSVWLAPGKRRSDRIRSSCTCPIGDDRCKHAVAVIAEYLAALAGNVTVPVASEDRRWYRMSEEASQVDDEFDECARTKK